MTLPLVCVNDAVHRNDSDLYLHLSRAVIAFGL
jgi:hypothetical protein